MDRVRFDAPRGQPQRNGCRDRQGFTLADDQFRGQNSVDTTTTVSDPHQLTVSSEDRSLPGFGDTRSFGDYPVEQERVNDTRARCDLSWHVSVVIQLTEARNVSPVKAITYAWNQRWLNTLAVGPVRISAMPVSLRVQWDV